ncbi:AAA family ATPase [Candidatus Bathycorpusculum sp.]|uniref:AAA family ATPase n=1 Tax=Candidatus Bathycorpusculum sp. TaxID=2994959 RepID=UPI00282C2D2B|nr:AAA family ATPase [Candidatus Termitimicrobium sp.]MCL2685050.1 AAA family ATPase [Candidatus Termitimicrobium sp.]
MAQISIGVESIDKAIGGGINPQTITLIYGEPETGKSTLAMQSAVYCALQGHKILYADCDNSFSTQRLAQLSGDRFDEVAERIILVKPQDFKEQTALIDHIEDYTTGVGLIVIDTFTSLYSAKAAEFSRAYGTNRELNRQLALLAQTVKTKKIPLVMTSQVRSVIGNDASDVRPVATRVLQFWAENILFLKPTQFPQTIKVTIEKVAGLPQSAICYVQIGGNGIKDTQLH